MGYRDRKNPWHVLFDEYKERHRDQIERIKTFHPLCYPYISIEFDDGSEVLYEGTTHLTKEVIPGKLDGCLWRLFCDVDDFNQGEHK